MAEQNPYDEDIKRNAQVSMLRGQEPTSHAMGGNSQADFLQHARRYAPNRTGRDGLMADQEFRQRFPNARVHKNDWLDLGDGSELIDSIQNFNAEADTGDAWQWLTESEALRGKAMEGQGRKAMGPQALIANDNSSLARILQELDAAGREEQSPAAREAVLAMLQGGV
jgi:hypothetical protein